HIYIKPLNSRIFFFLVIAKNWNQNRCTSQWSFFSVIEVKMTAPSMKERQVCWGARDDYWKCLDENIDDASKCKKLRTIFESSCPQQWIKYFDKRRDYLKFKEKFEAGQFEPSERTATS
uniref:Cytochrome c oxidase assembly factor 6 homolog n=2 Tax=Monodelphis domestica TaxID=13616 RepID=F7FG29_MONDO